MPVVKKADLKLELLALSEVAGGLRGLSAEEGHEGEDALIDANHDLLIELAALGEGGGVAEVVDMEKLGTALGGGSDEVGGEVLYGLDMIVHVEAVGVGDLGLNAEDGLDAPVAEGDGAMVEDPFEVDLHLGFVVLEWGDLADGGIDMDLGLDHFGVKMGLLGGNDAASDREDRAGLEGVDLPRLLRVLDDHLDESSAVAENEEVELPKGADGVEPSADKDLLTDLLWQLIG